MHIILIVSILIILWCLFIKSWKSKKVIKEKTFKINEMAKEEHRQIHQDLHIALDSLIADYIIHHPGDIYILDMPLINLLKWSHEQCLNPKEKE